MLKSYENVYGELIEEGYIRQRVPPGRDSRFYNPRVATMSRLEIDRLKTRRLRRILLWAFDNSPFYRRLYRDNGFHPSEVKTFRDITKVPTITGKDLSEHHSDIIVPSLKEAYSDFLVGKDNKLLGLGSMEYDLFCESLARSFWGAGLRPEGSFASYLDLGNWRPWGMASVDASKRCGFRTAPGSAEDYSSSPGRNTRLLNAHKIEVVVAAPELLLKMASDFKKEGLESPFKQLWSFSGESNKSELEDGHINCESVLNLWGTDEGFVAMECLFGGMHYWEDISILETVSGSGEGVPEEGEDGYLTATMLNHFTVPIIRLRMDFKVKNEWLTRPCDCGITHARVGGAIRQV